MKWINAYRIYRNITYRISGYIFSCIISKDSPMLPYILLIKRPALVSSYWKNTIPATCSNFQIFQIFVINTSSIHVHVLTLSSTENIIFILDLYQLLPFPFLNPVIRLTGFNIPSNRCPTPIWNNPPAFLRNRTFFGFFKDIWKQYTSIILLNNSLID